MTGEPPLYYLRSFKHGPAVGKYVAARILDGKPLEPVFSLATKARAQKRTVF